MDTYHAHKFYQKTGLVVSMLVIGLQIITCIHAISALQGIHLFTLIIPFLFAYILADFISGLIHMIMDNNSHYTSILGPFIAAFHLHHIKPKYSNKHALKVYFYESGTKFWLVAYLVILMILQHTIDLSPQFNFGLVSFGILSSFAEVSHFWCHRTGKQPSLILLLQKSKILLSQSHHRIHHTVDNKHYAFLNGITNPFLNLISKWLFDGYKNHVDQHAKAYRGQQTKNRC